MIVVQKYFRFLFAALIFLCLTSCHQERWNPDVSKIKLDVKMIRMEQILHNIKPDSFQAAIPRLQQAHPDFMWALMSQIYALRGPQEYKIETLRKFIEDRYMDTLYANVQAKYNDNEIHKIEDELAKAYKHIRYYFPNDSLPRFYTLTTGFTLKTPFTAGNTTVGIPLDMYMGKNYKYYLDPRLELPDYIIKTLEKDYIVPDVMRVVFTNKYEEGKQTDGTLLSNMIYYGKILFFQDVMQPGLADTLKIKYTNQQLGWSQYYEGNIWKAIVTNNMLYSKDQFKITKYMGDGPFTNVEGIPQEGSAPRLGEFIGWQIVKKYMKENPSVTLDQLFRDTNYRQILEKSGYKPKEKS
jgi:hypothetical protein